MINLHCGISSNYLHIEKCFYFSKTVFCFFFSGIPRKTLIDQSIPQVFFTLKRNDSQTFKSSNCEKLSNVYVSGTTSLDKYFLFHLIIERHCFLLKFIIVLRLFSTAMFLISLKEVIRKKSILFFISTITAMLITVFQNEALLYHACQIFITFIF